MFAAGGFPDGLIHERGHGLRLARYGQLDVSSRTEREDPAATEAPGAFRQHCPHGDADRILRLLRKEAAQLSLGAAEAHGVEAFFYLTVEPGLCEGAENGAGVAAQTARRSCGCGIVRIYLIK